MTKRFLAAFGGGCHMVNEVWVPTSDFEVWPLGPNGGRSLTRQPFDDDNPDSVCAEGELILNAAVVDHENVTPDAVAIAYGDSSPSLQLAGHPSENEVMSKLFQEKVPEAKVKLFDPKEWNSEGKFSGTYHEAANLLRLARRDNFEEMIILRRRVHLRAIVFTMIRLNEPEFADLRQRILDGTFRIQEHIVEDVLADGPSQYSKRLETILRSRSFQRSLLREGNALMNFGKGQTQIVQKPPEQNA